MGGYGGWHRSQPRASDIPARPILRVHRSAKRSSMARERGASMSPAVPRTLFRKKPLSSDDVSPILPLSLPVDHRSSVYGENSTPHALLFDGDLNLLRAKHEALIIESSGWTTWVIDASFARRLGDCLRLCAAMFGFALFMMAISAIPRLLNVYASPRGTALGYASIFLFIMMSIMSFHHMVTYRTVLAIAPTGNIIIGTVKKKELHYSWDPSLYSELKPTSLKLKPTNSGRKRASEYKLIATATYGDMVLIKRISPEDFRSLWLSNFAKPPHVEICSSTD